MAETKLTNSQIDPQVFTDYTLEESIKNAAFFKSGIITRSSLLDNFLNGNGEMFALPFWKSISGTTGDIPSESTDATINNLTSAKQLARKQVREKVWGTNSLVTTYAGSNPLDGAIAEINQYWAEAMDQIAIKSIQGVVANDIADDSSSIIKDVSSETGTAAYFSSDYVIDAMQLLGEKKRGFKAILVHSAVHAWMQKQDLIDYVPDSQQNRMVETYMGMEVLIDDYSPLSSSVYDSIILKPGALAFGIGSQGYEPTKLGEKELLGFGTEYIITRRAFAMHPLGTAMQESNISGISPTDAELVQAATWDKVVNANNMPFVVLRHKIG
jgi:hypothetical protein